MIKLKDLRADTPTRIPYTEEQILVMVIKGKQWGHTFGRARIRRIFLIGYGILVVRIRDRQVFGLGKTPIFDSQPRSTYFQLEIDHMLTKRDQALAAANAQAKVQRRELEELRSVVRSNTRMAELLINLGSRSEVGSGSESGNGGDGDDDADVDEEEGH
uniref:Uncharacterized protein n=1 Tax=Tanacetum cinerariifolium TaxID=118510 RepID=A0A6L2LZB3_TANCI|nr:hypothetical protein [Tanacetum cinerariifolium]